MAEQVKRDEAAAARPEASYREKELKDRADERQWKRDLWLKYGPAAPKDGK